MPYSLASWWTTACSDQVAAVAVEMDPVWVAKNEFRPSGPGFVATYCPAELAKSRHEEK